ncbi:MAG: hypothetical protein LLG06_11655 [Desulfobacteraceae bacterium]|nr:hypothetical protein [Desulfobacteraceae bacterium]
MKVCALVDFVGTSEQTPEEEYAEIKRRLCELLDISPANMTYKTEVFPHQLNNESLDLYVIDFGGVLPGCEDTIVSQFGELLNQIENKPSTLFVIWSRFTAWFYEEAIRKYHPDISAPNVSIWTDRDTPEGYTMQELEIIRWFRGADYVPPGKSLIATILDDGTGESFG